MADATQLASGLATLSGILQRDKRRGTSTLACEAATLERLRQLPAALRGMNRRDATPPPAAEKDAAEAVPAPPMVPAPAPALAVTPVLDEAARRQGLNAIFHQVKAARLPETLGTVFSTLVFASGNPMADILFVGEAPGAEEEKVKKPFVGPAGQMLEKILKAMGLGRDEVYISNLVKYRPKMDDGRMQGSRIRPPTIDEMAASLPFIRAEIELLRPKVIVALGRTAAEGLLERSEPIAAFRSQAHTFAGIPVVVTYHPSYLLRQDKGSEGDDMRAKRLVWEDMLRAMEFAGLPISEKQRGFFR